MTEDVALIGSDRGRHRRQLPEEVAAYVRELILSGAVRAGEFLRMERIAESVGVSNTPVREGLLALRSEGFVRLEPRRGFVVAAFTRQDVRDLFWAQGQLASELAARATRKITPDHLARLEAIDARFHEALADNDYELVAELGRAFHREINKAADSNRLALLLESVAHHLPTRLYATIEGRLTSTGDRHREILAALRGRDSRKARSLMQHHILEGADHLVEVLEQRGLWSAEQELRP